MVIKCKWAEGNRVIVNPDGQVFPCCYLANGMYQAKIEENTYRINLEHVDIEYKKSEDELNLKNKPIGAILNHEWFSKTLPESWEDESKTHRNCRMFCGVKENNDG